jgi:hypothetical protein
MSLFKDVLLHVYVCALFPGVYFVENGKFPRKKFIWEKLEYFIQKSFSQIKKFYLNKGFLK